jgi:hypothetical protein
MEICERIVLMLCLSVFAFISIQLIWSSNVVGNVKFLMMKDAKPKYFRNEEKGQKRQRICILAGPHKTGTSSVQANMYQWSAQTSNFTDTELDPLAEPLIQWVWPVPLSIAEIESKENKTWNWSPSKIFYPMMENLIVKGKKEKRTIFKKFNREEIIEIYRTTLLSQWNDGKDIVFGTEAMDLIVKLREGPSMLHTISDSILPSDIEGDQVTAVVMYRDPKIEHLISIWHENCNREVDPKFFEWITTTTNTYGPIDSLGMVDMMLRETNWNVVLIDLNRARLDDWDISNFIACKVLEEDCNNRTLSGMHASPIVANVRKYGRTPNVPNITLDEIDVVLKNYDCNYQHLFAQNSTNRFKIYYDEGLAETMDSCRNLGEDKYPISRVEMKKQIEKIALKHGSIEFEDSS